jgi:hypothetical protein
MFTAQLLKYYTNTQLTTFRFIVPSYDELCFRCSGLNGLHTEPVGHLTGQEISHPI